MSQPSTPQPDVVSPSASFPDHPASPEPRLNESLGPFRLAFLALGVGLALSLLVPMGYFAYGRGPEFGFEWLDYTANGLSGFGLSAGLVVCFAAGLALVRQQAAPRFESIVVRAGLLVAGGGLLAIAVAARSTNVFLTNGGGLTQLVLGGPGLAVVLGATAVASILKARDGHGPALTILVAGLLGSVSVVALSSAIQREQIFRDSPSFGDLGLTEKVAVLLAGVDIFFAIAVLIAGLILSLHPPGRRNLRVVVAGVAAAASVAASIRFLADTLSDRSVTGPGDVATVVALCSIGAALALLGVGPLKPDVDFRR